MGIHKFTMIEQKYYVIKMAGWKGDKSFVRVVSNKIKIQ